MRPFISRKRRLSWDAYFRRLKRLAPFMLRDAIEQRSRLDALAFQRGFYGKWASDEDVARAVYTLVDEQGNTTEVVGPAPAPHVSIAGRLSE